MDSGRLLPLTADGRITNLAHSFRHTQIFRALPQRDSRERGEDGRPKRASRLNSSASGTFEKEDRAKEILAGRREQTGSVCIFSAMEPRLTYKPWHNKPTGKTYLMPDDSKCLH